MENFKVKVKNEAESKEVQELAFQLGFPWFGTSEQVHQSRIGMFFTTKCNGVNIVSYDEDYSIDLPNHKEITIQELRDMVVLKRNDVNDANYEAIGTNFYKGANWYKWDASIGKWIEYVGSYTNLLDSVKPIQNKEIDKPVVAKEYLVKDKQTGEYYQENNPASYDDAIEIPEGADTLAGDLRNDKYFYFWNHEAMQLIGCGKSLSRYPIWTDLKDSANEWVDQLDDENIKILWQRNNQETVEQFNPEDVVKSDFPDFNYNAIEPKVKSLDKLSIGEVNYRAAQAFNQVKGTKDLITEDDVRLISELIELVKCHGASNETDMPF